MAGRHSPSMLTVSIGAVAPFSKLDETNRAENLQSYFCDAEFRTDTFVLLQSMVFSLCFCGITVEVIVRCRAREKLR